MEKKSSDRKIKPLTPRQREVFDFIVQWIRETRFPPTLSEVAQFLGVPYPKSAVAHLDALEKKGFIQRLSGKARGIKITPLGQSLHEESVSDGMLSLPILGRIRAGVPTGTDPYQEGTLSVPRTLFSEKPDFVLRIQGDSMTGSGIFEGDWVFVKKTQEVRNGDIVVAQIQGEMTLKHLVVQKNRIVLKASNSRYPDRIVHPEDESGLIQGRMVGLYRGMNRQSKEGTS